MFRFSQGFKAFALFSLFAAAKASDSWPLPTAEASR
jgi:hypothetical protein